MGDDSGDRRDPDLASLFVRVDALTDALGDLEEELRSVRDAVDDVIDRLDAGLVLADEIEGAPASVPAELSDLLGSLRAEVATGFEVLEGKLSAEVAPGVEVGRFHEALEELRVEMVELRRRIQLRAEGRALSDEQLEQIAEFVVQRLAPTKGRANRG